MSGNPPDRPSKLRNKGRNRQPHLCAQDKYWKQVTDFLILSHTLSDLSLQDINDENVTLKYQAGRQTNQPGPVFNAFCFSFLSALPLLHAFILKASPSFAHFPFNSAPFDFNHLHFRWSSNMYTDVPRSSNSTLHELL